MLLDKIDKQILNALFENGRESLTNLEKTIHKSDNETMSHTGISKRISKLEDSAILRVQANTNVNTLQYKTLFILIEMANYEGIQKLIEAYSECPRVFLLAHVSGQYNLIIGIVGQNIEVLHRFINHCGPTNKPGILHSATIFASELIKPNYLPLNLFSNQSKEQKCGNICQECEAFLDGDCAGCGEF
ncbi:MAG: Lrp/AsnC family transcriptional regulator [Candidatus Lokiarchaeota archaeon]|jgi:DNA-binding Lrp family transcriptional regulator